MTCNAASAKRSSPDAPIGLEQGTPPDGLTGSRPPSCVSPASVSRQPTGPGEAQVFQPHRLEPGERDVDLGDVDLVDRAGDAGLAPLGHLAPVGFSLTDLSFFSAVGGVTTATEPLATVQATSTP